MSCCCPKRESYNEVGSKVSGNGPDAPVRNKIERYAVSVEVKEDGVEAVDHAWKQGQPQQARTPGTVASDATNDESLKIIACERQISDLTFGEIPGIKAVDTNSFEEPPELVRRPETDHAEPQLGVGSGISVPLKRPETDHPEPKPGEDPRGHPLPSDSAPGTAAYRDKSILDAKEGFERFVATIDSSSTMDPVGLNISQTSSFGDGENSEDELERSIPLHPSQNQAVNYAEETRRSMNPNSADPPSSSLASGVRRPDSSLEGSSHIPDSPAENTLPPPPRHNLPRNDTTPPAPRQSRRQQEAELTAAAIKVSQLTASPPRQSSRQPDSDFAAAAIKASQLPDPRFIRSRTEPEDRTDSEDPPTPPPVQSPSVSPVVDREKKSAGNEAYNYRPNEAREEKKSGDDETHYNSHEPNEVAHSTPEDSESDLFSAQPSDTALVEGEVGDESNDAPVVPAESLSVATEQEDGDALSDVPSDVDPELQERYLKACRILKSALIQKRHDLSSSDLGFFHKLLLADKDQRSPSEAAMAAVENASEVLTQNQSSVDMRNGLLRVKSQMEEQSAASVASFSVHDNVKRIKEPIRIALREDGEDPSVQIIGKLSAEPGVLTSSMMNGLRQVLPTPIRDGFPNFSLKFSSDNEPRTLKQVLPLIEKSRYTIIGVETTSGDVFGCFCSSQWKTSAKWFGSRNAFLWRLAKSRVSNDNLEIYKYTGADDLIQYCTEQSLTVGGGDWRGSSGSQDRSLGIGFTIDGDMLGGETNSCSTFGNPSLCGKGASSSEFDVATIEVWELRPRI